jgi:hypothetical protein
MKNIILFSSLSAVALFGCGKGSDDTSTVDTAVITDTSDTGEMKEVESYAMTASAASVSTREVVNRFGTVPSM